MGALEALSGELACQHITDAELRRVKDLHERMVRTHENGALRDYFKLNEQIHQMILDAARNPTLAQMQLSLSGRVRRARYLANMTPGRWAEAVAEHTRILEALSARDGKRLAVILKEHLANKLQTVKDALTE